MRVATLAARGGSTFPIALATIALFAISPVVASGSLQQSALATTLPFAAILIVVAAGQTLVIQQGGLDFSVPGMISLSAVVLAKTAQGDSARLVEALVVVFVIAVCVGLLNGFVVTRLGVTPLIATLAVNALLLGAVQQVSNGVQVPATPTSLVQLALGKTFGVFNVVIGALAVVAIHGLVVKRTVYGRRFEAVGAGSATAHLAGLPVSGYKVAAYVGASISYALAGVMLAGFLQVPSLDVGNSYLLASIAAAVLGGAALSGGRGSVVASAIGAVFLTQLSQLLLIAGVKTSVNLLVQGAAIGASMAVRSLIERWRIVRYARLAATPHERSVPATTDGSPETPPGVVSFARLEPTNASTTVTSTTSGAP